MNPRSSIRLGLVALLLALCAGILTDAARPTAAQATLTITLQPASGVPSNEVVVYGSGAPANARVNVYYAPFNAGADCRASAPGTLLGETTADAAGRFAMSHFPTPEQTNTAGYTYMARLVSNQAASNRECYTFSGTPISRYFPETGKWVRDEFLRYWEGRGGLEIFGYPITSEVIENGRITQYFERAIFALHPENQPPWNVLLRLLGADLTAHRRGEAPFQRAPRQNSADCIYFDPTGHNVCGNFKRYWEQFGGLPVYGYPISEPFQERIVETDQIYTVQYFERERFELHPGAWPARHDVLLGRLGAQALPPGGVTEGPVRIELPADGSRQSLPLRLLVRTNQAGEEVTAHLRYADGTELSHTYMTIQGEDQRGLLIDSLNFDNEGVPPMPPTQPATLEIRDKAGRVIASSRLTMIGFNDPESQPLQIYMILPFDPELYRATQVRVPRTTAVGTAALEQLLWGPTPPNLAGFVTAIPTPHEVLSFPGREADWGPRVRLLRLTIENGVATADFSQEMRAYGGGSARVQAIREQITRTLMQFPTVREVRIAIEGNVDALQP